MNRADWIVGLCALAALACFVAAGEIVRRRAREWKLFEEEVNAGPGQYPGDD